MSQRLTVLSFVETQPTQHLGNAYFISIAAGNLKSNLGLTVCIQQRLVVFALAGGRFGQLVSPLCQRHSLGAQRRKDAKHCLVQCSLAGWGRVLGQIPDGQPTLAMDPARGRGLHAGQDTQERCFAHPVRADKANAIADFNA